jgi:hypothetical protein
MVKVEMVIKRIKAMREKIVLLKVFFLIKTICNKKKRGRSGRRDNFSKSEHAKNNDASIGF